MIRVEQKRCLQFRRWLEACPLAVHSSTESRGTAKRKQKMEIGMRMRAVEDVGIGEDITPPIPPLSYSLHDSFLHSHCSSCFSPLPPRTNFPSSPSPFPFPNHPLYCSPQCSLSDSTLHSLSSESQLLSLLHFHSSLFPLSSQLSADLRAALRFLCSHFSTSPPTPHRISGLLTNRDKFISRENSDKDEIVVRIREGARAMAIARRMMREGRGLDGVSLRADDEENDVVLAEAALCLVLTNSVEVQDWSGRLIGVAVYGPSFCWINHSCSPNACYRISFSEPLETSTSRDNETRMRIGPYQSCGDREDDCQVMESAVCSTSEFPKECKPYYGPSIIVRSIKRIEKGQEVTVTYTDLLQPQATRQLDLWSKYCFVCCCQRCNSSPPTYVDRALEVISAVNLDAPSTNNSFCTYKATERLTVYIEEAIADYLLIGDPESCCTKLEHVLTHGLLDKQFECDQVKSQSAYWLHPLHHLSLNAYTTLASAYKIRASDLLALCSEKDDLLFDALDMSRSSAAYSLLLAGATHHLFCFESSLIASVANFFTNAGESLLTFARSSAWSELTQWGLPVFELPSIAQHKCSKCSLLDISKINSFHNQVQSAEFESISSEFLHCISNYTNKVWNFFSHGHHHLEAFKDPFDFSYLAITNYSNIWETNVHTSSAEVVSNCSAEVEISDLKAQVYNHHGRILLFQLGVHCLLYGGYLASICYGGHSHLTSQVQNILDLEDNLISPRHGRHQVL